MPRFEQIPRGKNLDHQSVVLVKAQWCVRELALPAAYDGSSCSAVGPTIAVAHGNKLFV